MQKVKIDSFNIIGISIRTTNEQNLAATQIAELWGRFMAENTLDAIPGKIDQTIYSLYTDYEGDHSKPYTAILGCKVRDLNSVPEGMIGKTVSGGDYHKTTAKGDLTKGLIVNEWQTIWKQNWDRAYTADFEVFGEKAQNPNDAEVDFLVAVK